MGKVVFKATKQFHVEGTDDDTTDWPWHFLYAFDDEDDAIAEAQDIRNYRFVRVVDTHE